MRLAILALSAAALSGCSWLGSGYKAPGANCVPAGYSGHGYQATGHHYGYAPNGPACVGGSYGVKHTYGQSGYAAGYGGAHYQGYAAMNAHGHPGQTHAVAGLPPQPHGGQSFAAQRAQFQTGQMRGPQFQGAQFQNSQFQGTPSPAMMASGYPQTVTTLGAAAPYGAAVGAGFGQSAQFAGQGQFAGGYGGQVITGAPIYVPQPYPAPYPVPPVNPAACCGVSGGSNISMPMGFEFFGGTEIEGMGDIFTKKSDGPPDGDYSIGIRVGEIGAISYGDAFGPTKQIGGALAYDVSPTTTVLGSVSYGRAEGQTVENYTTVEPGTWTGTSFTSSGAPRSLDGTFTDLETATIEGGVRSYVGHNPSLRPYFGVSGGFTHNNAVTFTQTYNDDGSAYGQRQFIDSGWSPTAAATIGAEMAIGPRSAIGFESGVRWRDNMDTAAPSEDRVTIPLTLRGRLAF